MSTLYLVSTPIGNLGDLSTRARDTLRSVDRILAEDTRRTRILAEYAGSTATLVSLHQHNERQRTERVLEWLDAGEELALVSDAGTPLVSDPGALVVSAVAEAGHTVVPVPGPSAVIAALVASGLPTERFCFLGFPKRKGKDRAVFLLRVAEAAETVVLFESPQRAGRLLEELATVCGPERRASVARELTKVHEEVRRGTLGSLADYYLEHPPKGEVTLVVGAAEEVPESESGTEEAARAVARDLLSTAMRPSEVSKEIRVRLALSRNAAYRIVQETQEDMEPG